MVIFILNKLSNVIDKNSIGSSIILEEVRTRSFLKCILNKTKAIEKQLKRSRSKESKESKFVMLGTSASCFFLSLNVKKFSTGLNKKKLCFFCFDFFNIHFRKKYN